LRASRGRLRAAAALLACAGALWLPAVARAAPGAHVEAALVAASDGIVAGAPLTIGLRLRHAPGWHTYWQLPGDSGLPTRVNWRLPPGVRIGPLQWPAPRRLPVGPLLNFGYDGEVILLAEIELPPGQARGAALQVEARADWLACREICIPEGADLTLRLPVRAAGAQLPSDAAAAIAASRMRIPAPLALPDATVLRDGARLRLAFVPPAEVAARAPAALAFFPLEERRIEAAAPQVLEHGNGAGDPLVLHLTATLPVEAGFDRLRGVLVADEGAGAAGGWAGTIDVAISNGRFAAAAPATPGPGASAAAGAAGGARGVTWLTALVGAFVGGLILNLMPCVFPVLSLKLLGLLARTGATGPAARPLALPGADPRATPAVDPGAGAGATAHQAKLADPPLVGHGLAFAAGVLASFLVLAGVLIVLQAAGQRLGWGFQLQSPAVVVTLTALFFLIGLNLAGLFEWTAGSALAGSTAALRAQGVHGASLAGSAATGVLAVVAAAPCTAPFMGAALGFAATQPAPVALSIFASVGLGMALPYLLLTRFPAALRHLPRPGAWMERFRQAMAFPMFATCIWLLWVLGQQIDIHGVAEVLLGLLALALAGWAFGWHQRGARGWRWAALAAAAAAIWISATAVGRPVESRAAVALGAPDTWQPWSDARVGELNAARRPLFVDFTAAWCVTCQVNKRLVLERPAVAQAFAANGVVRLRADWTQRDDAITAALVRFGRNGVPMYLLYDAAGRPTLLPELLTERLVLEALAGVAVGSLPAAADAPPASPASWSAPRPEAAGVSVAPGTTASWLKPPP
jgi:thiol:disulfide interchange protein DsbD